MARGVGRGLFRKGGKGVWYARRRVPDDVQAAFGKVEFKASMQTEAVDLAMARRETWWRERDADITAARRAGSAPIATLADVVEAIDRWRASECAATVAAPLPVPPLPAGAGAAVRAVLGTPAPPLEGPELFRPIARRGEGARAALDLPKAICAPEIEGGLLAAAEAYFTALPDAERTPSMSTTAGLMIPRLDTAATDKGGWQHVEGFDAQLEAVTKAGGLRGVLTPAIVAAARPGFARAWAEVARFGEHERQRHALVLATLRAMQSAPGALTMLGASAYVPRIGDKTIGEVIEAVRREKAATQKDSDAGEAYVRKNYLHIFRALEELIGSGTPVRAVDHDDVLDIRTLLRRLPANVTKRFTGVPLVQAAELTEAAGLDIMEWNTSRSYMVNLSAIFNLAERKGWVEKNPVKGAIPQKRDSVKRRGYTRQELEQVFAGIEHERGSDRWWVLALLFWHGARASEMCQLLPGDVKAIDGVPYIDLSRFDASGRLVEEKALKNAGSERCLPIHPEVIEAGFLDFVCKRHNAGRLFPVFRRHDLGGFSHDLSKWFGRYMDRIGLDEPALTLHGARHGFRDACRAAHLPPEVTEALGGWSAKGVGQGYGDRFAVKVNVEHMAKVSLDGFKLPPAAVGGGGSSESFGGSEARQSAVAGAGGVP